VSASLTHTLYKYPRKIQLPETATSDKNHSLLCVIS